MLRRWFVAGLEVHTPTQAHARPAAIAARFQHTSTSVMCWPEPQCCWQRCACWHRPHKRRLAVFFCLQLCVSLQLAKQGLRFLDSKLPAVSVVAPMYWLSAGSHRVWGLCVTQAVQTVGRLLHELCHSVCTMRVDDGPPPQLAIYPRLQHRILMRLCQACDCSSPLELQHHLSSISGRRPVNSIAAQPAKPPSSLHVTLGTISNHQEHPHCGRRGQWPCVQQHH